MGLDYFGCSNRMFSVVVLKYTCFNFTLFRVYYKFVVMIYIIYFYFITLHSRKFSKTLDQQSVTIILQMRCSIGLYISSLAGNVLR